MQENAFVTPGWIDSHVHCYEHSTPLGINVDKYCLARGVTTVVDAGSAGNIFPDNRFFFLQKALTLKFKVSTIDMILFIQQLLRKKKWSLQIVTSKNWTKFIYLQGTQNCMKKKRHFVVYRFRYLPRSSKVHH